MVDVTPCNITLRLAGQPYPRTCAICGLGPCHLVKELPVPVPDPAIEITHFSRMQVSTAISHEQIVKALATDVAERAGIMDFELSEWKVQIRFANDPTTGVTNECLLVMVKDSP